MHTITFEYSELGMPSAWYKATVATCTYNNSTARKFVPGAVKAITRQEAASIGLWHVAINN